MADRGMLYVSFSGESSTPETNVLALSCADGSTRGPALKGTPPFKELRGLALAPNAKMLGVTCVKKDSLVFGFAPEQTGFAWDFCGLSIANTVSPGLFHPYGIAFADDHTLFISSQNSNVVTRFVFKPDGAQGASCKYAVTAPEIAKYLDKFSKKHDPFYAGTWVASATGIDIGGDTPPDVAPDEGGLTFEDGSDDKHDKKHSVRGILIAGGTLYVADQAKDRIAMYELASGKYLGKIEKTGDDKAHETRLSKPVGLALGPDGRVYIGSPGNASIFAYTPAKNALAWVATDTTALAEVSGLAFSPTTLYTASRKTMAVYTFTPDAGKPGGGTFTQFNKAAFTDSPECLLYVPAR
jgi:sugar lactone lactonase YvrE